MAKKISNLLFVFTIFIFLIINVSRAIFSPDNKNEYENRKANKMDSFSISGFLNGTFQDSMEAALSDQVFFAQEAKMNYNKIVSSYMQTTITPIANKNRYIYLSDNFYLYGEDTILYEPYIFSELTGRLDKRTNLYNKIFAKYPDVDFYVYYIEKDTDINFETGEKSYVYNYLKERLNLPETNSGVFSINNFEDFSSYFYKTDHHWNAEGSKKGYEQVIRMLLGEEEPVIKPDQFSQVPGIMFSGSKTTSAATGSYSEPFWAYTYTYTPMTITENGIEVEDFGNQQSYMAGKETTISYSQFYGGDMGEIIFDTSRPEKDNILIIGESFDNAILKLVASHFNVTVSIDLRNYETFMEEKFSLKKHLKKHKIDKVLLIGNADYFLLDEFVLE
ncbi:MAG: hypothetical protein IKV86_00885 [Clostridia bacterium]|nr:hypothetical protein [Clostridia bacterium]